MKVDRFAMFENYFVAAGMLPSRERSGLFLLAIAQYMFEDVEPEWEETELEYKCWKLVLPGLNFSKKQSANGVKAKGAEKPGMRGNKNALKDKSQPPTMEEVKSYAQKIGYDEKRAEKFFFHYDGHSWPDNWKSTLKSWQIKDEGNKRFDRLHVGVRSPEDYEGEF